MTMSGLTITGTGSYLPDTRLDVATAAGRYDGEGDRIRGTGYDTVCAEEKLYPADMALIAARRALEAARLEPSDIDLLAVTAIHRHGHKRLWSPASWLQSRLGCPRALPLTVNQGCNAQMLVLEVAGGYLSGRPRGSALVVAADQFASSGFDRFTADYGIVYGDGSAAAVLTNGLAPGQAEGSWRVRAAHTVSAPELEGLHRADAPAPEDPELLHAEHDVRSAKRRFLSERGRELLKDSTRSAVREIRASLLPDGDHPRLRRIVYPNLGLPLLEENYFPELPGGAEKSLWDFGRTVGHLGSGDQIAGLDHLTTHHTYTAGDQVLLLGAGAGFTWTGTLLEHG
ncbi:ketoacyl-ACP synthase III family protein [Streptomyces sp. A3M-1-3]|uniref:ketoacyl-ACP synthase III family protein n=1 Tax=Streptomyces sp. A3M-1-3 TaxID=2962044 RepID=UPI0020B84CB1|nr:ketoacyl-ACP synthase III family protein [Streptomyces sp. A3M-1-3]MCP3821642.1 ketoacyl-ACP synthase III family protein [Streptomyces sp. A3M-1-3]